MDESTPRDISHERGHHSDRRITVLDGFRALAILLVIGFHYFSRWTPPQASVNKYPYGRSLADFVLFKYGYLGVELFFIISGFVISMTLFKSSSLLDFARKRFARLFPTMLLCSVLTFIVVKIFPRAGFSSHVKDFLPSLTFTDPILWNKFFDGTFRAMDGVYWSLFVEVKFYFWIGIIFFLGGAKRFFTATALLFPALAVSYVVLIIAGTQYAATVAFIFALAFMPWFVAGIGFYALFIDHRSRAGWILIVETWMLAAVVSVGGPADIAAVTVSMLMFSALFFVMLFRPRWVSWLAARPMAAVGAASYSLYLLHQRIGVILLTTTGDYLPVTWRLWSWWLAPCVAGLLIGASLVIYRYWEMPAKRFLLRPLCLGSRPGLTDKTSD